MAENYLYNPPDIDDVSYLALTANLKKTDLTCDQPVLYLRATQHSVSPLIGA